MKKKLNISDLRINSFVTDLSDTTAKTVKGGFTADYNCSAGCGTNYCPTNKCTAVNCGSANPC